MREVPKQQTGASFFGTLIVVLMIGTFVAIGFKLYSPYLEHQKWSLPLSCLTSLSNGDNNRSSVTCLITPVSLGRCLIREKMAGVAGFEPTHDGIKTRCLTAWLYPCNGGNGGTRTCDPRIMNALL
jgi:hypothetical protein